MRPYLLNLRSEDLAAEIFDVIFSYSAAATDQSEKTMDIGTRCMSTAVCRLRLALCAM